MGFLSEIVSSAEVQTLDPLSALISTVFTLLSALPLTSKDYPKQAEVEECQCFDYIIVGAGSAGCVLASRLSDNKNASILLLEAGGDPMIDASIPGLVPFIFFSNAQWNYYTVNDKYSSQSFKAKSIHLAIGKQLGGSSGDNFMFYIRGNPLDYDEWEEMGNKHWSWKNVLPYFKKSERLNVEPILESHSACLHGTEGCLGVTRPDWGDKVDEYLEAFQQAGHKTLIDTNGYEQLGYSQPTYTVDNKIRQSTAYAFLRYVKNRENLFVRKNTCVIKVLFDEDKKATGVEAKLENGQRINLCARKEVILSAGAINTPIILMRSGVGPKDQLEENGVDLLYESPHVGQNLQDQPYAIISISGKKDLVSVKENVDTFLNLDKFPIPTIVGFASLNKSDCNTKPDYQVFCFSFGRASVIPTVFSTYAFKYEDELCTAIADSAQKSRTLLAVLALLHPKSRGQVRLNGTNPDNNPIIYSGFYEDESDLDKHARCVKDYLKVVDTPYFNKVNGEVIDFNMRQCKYLEFGSHEYWKCHIRNIAFSLWNYSGTCAMGPEGVGVVDNRLRVYGVRSLRVADASAMPKSPSGNHNAPTIMIAEKAADMIKEDNGCEIDSPVNRS